MKIKILPSTAKGIITAPPSKSMAHRMLICAGLASGSSVIRGISGSEDISATVDCLSALGAKIDIQGNTAYVTGTDVLRSTGNVTLPCRESGSTLRFMIPICMALDGITQFTGSQKLLSRPLDVYSELAKNCSILFENDGKSIRVGGKLTSGEYTLRGDISSQFISGLDFILPLLDGKSKIKLTPPVASRPYIDMTLSALEKSGIVITEKTENEFIIPGNQRYAPIDAQVEGDCSNAAFLDALNLFGGDVRVSGIDPGTKQGDVIYKKHFESLTGGYCRIDLTDCPDLGPILFTVAAMLDGAEFTGTERLRIKESDRVECMRRELEKCNVRMNVQDDRVIIERSDVRKPAETLDSHNDHRIVMALSVLLTVFGGEINGAEAVRKSYPDFFEALKKLGIKVENYGMDM